MGFAGVRVLVSIREAVDPFDRLPQEKPRIDVIDIPLGDSRDQYGSSRHGPPTDSISSSTGSARIARGWLSIQMRYSRLLMSGSQSEISMVRRHSQRVEPAPQLSDPSECPAPTIK